MSEKDLKIAKQIKKELKAKLGDKLISVILYGSRARGDFHDESDMDLLILTSKRNNPKTSFFYSLHQDAIKI
ncbi:MAG: Uncharacterized protein Athens101428_353 [Candidatus Berkelbacteria bacterium Athens1014_28]|uniref:Polymerase nucleotidyl transferase domain-containing protein n=1 Tax=Candidatus Berkelbacteria bacterium Athens1014_28 TaxID=2017145 RepID=A0A554LN53_9BACT|nr:MAG: Uncharacterized protein Athens101428_353 [Candidatus Berkelbacteria bacterium Athens1014_28]